MKILNTVGSFVRRQSKKIVACAGALGTAALCSAPAQAAIDLSTTEFDTGLIDSWFPKVLAVVMLLVGLGVIIAMSKKAR